jgi:hypothetical protein
MVNDVTGSKPPALPVDRNGRSLAGLCLPIVDGTGQIIGWAPIASTDQGDGTLALKVDTELVVEDAVINVSPDVNVEKWGGTAQTGADLTPLFQHLDTDLSVLATEATLSSLEGKDFATETTLGTLLTEATFTAEDFATEATLLDVKADLDSALLKLDDIVTNTAEIRLDADTINMNADSINLNVDEVEAKLDTLIAKDYSTETTLAAIKADFEAEDFATETTLALIKDELDTVEAKLQSIIDNTDSLEVNTDDLEAKVQSVRDQLDVLLSTRASEATLAALEAKDFATETTLALIKTDVDKIPADPAREGGNLATLAGKDFATQTTLAVLAGKDFATQATLAQIKTQLTTQVRGLFDSAGNAITSSLVSTKQALDVNVVSSQSSTATAVDLGQSFGLAFDFSLPTAGTFNPVLLLKNPIGSGKRIRITRLNVGLTIANVSGIWRVFANPTVSANGTAISPVNLNVGGASNPATISQTFTTPTITANGASLFRYESGQNMNSTEVIGDALFVINPGNVMLLTGDPLSNNRNTVITVYWTEVV